MTSQKLVTARMMVRESTAWTRNRSDPLGSHGVEKAANLLSTQVRCVVKRQWKSDAKRNGSRYSCLCRDIQHHHIRID